MDCISLMLVSDGEERKPGASIRCDTMNEFKRSSEVAVNIAWDLIHHMSSMLDSKEPVVTGHSHFSEVGTSHGADSLPCFLTMAIGGLAASRSPNNFRVIAQDPSTSITPHKFRITVTTKLPR